MFAITIFILFEPEIIGLTPNTVVEPKDGNVEKIYNIQTDEIKIKIVQFSKDIFKRNT